MNTKFIAILPEGPGSLGACAGVGNTPEEAWKKLQEEYEKAIGGDFSSRSTDVEMYESTRYGKAKVTVEIVWE